MTMVMILIDIIDSNDHMQEGRSAIFCLFIVLRNNNNMEILCAIA